MNDPKSKINRLTSASLDLENCMRFLEESINQQFGSIVYESLLISAIVFYARPFSENQKRGSSEPSDPRVPIDVLDHLNKDEMILHNQLVELRNKAIAHAEWKYHPVGVSERKVIKAMPFYLVKHSPCRNRGEVMSFLNLAGKVRHAIQLAQGNALHELP